MPKETIIIPVSTYTFTGSRKELNDKLLETAKGGYKRIGVDISTIDYLDSESVGLIAFNFVILSEMGIELSIVNPEPKVKLVLDRTGLSKIIMLETAQKLA